MKRTQLAISALLVGTAIQAQAREISVQDIAVPVTVLGTETVEQNLTRLEDISNVCAVNRGNPAYGANATPGKVADFQIRGIKSEYGSRYGDALNGFTDAGYNPITPDGQPLLQSEIQRFELLQTPQGLNCEVYPDLNTLAAGGGTPPITAASDPTLDVQGLPPEVYQGRAVRSAADVRAELDGLVQLCRSGADDDTIESRKERYRSLFDELREFGAIRSDLRERLLLNDPELNQEDAINQLKKLDPAVDGAVFPSQLKCPPTPTELVESRTAPQSLYIGYSTEAAVDHLELLAGLEGDEKGSLPESQRMGVYRPISPNPGQLSPEQERFAINLKFGGSLGETDFGNGQTGIGFQTTGPGTEIFADTSPSRFDSAGLQVGVEFPVSDKATIGLNYGYSEGDARKDFDIPAGGAIDVGNVYGDLSPSGSTGLNIGNRGLSGFNETDFKLHDIKLSATTPISDEQAFSSTATLFINALFMDRHHRGQTNATVFGTPISQRRDQEIQDRLFGLGGILNGRLRIADGVTGTGSIAGGIYYRDTDLKATEINDCGLCPPADRNFTLNFDETDSGVSFAGSVSAGLEFDITSSLKFTAGADASYLSDVGQIINPSSGDQVLAGETTRLGTTDAWRWRATAGVKLAFR